MILCTVDYLRSPFAMPLVKLFTPRSLAKAVPLVPLQLRLCEIWGVKPSTTKLMRFEVADWTSEEFHEDVYVDVRAKATPDRTRDIVLANMKAVQDAFADHDLVANVRLETYKGDNYFHLPPSGK